jgi:hypothetical protein
MLEKNNEDVESKENVLLLNNKSFISRDKGSEINTNKIRIMNNIQDIK